MSTTRNLLVELLVEELPPKALRALSDAFASKLQEGLQLNDFLEPGSEVTTFATPRRLAAHISHVRSDSQPRPLPPRTLMPVAVAYKDGSPTAALEKRIRSLYSEGVSIESLYRERRLFNVVEDGKDVVKHDPGLAAGSSLHVALEGFVLDAIAKLPIPKLMQYQLERGEGPDFQPGWTSVNFVRPAHGLVALHGETVVDVQALGLRATRCTQGHRFEAAVPVIELRSADSYAEQLQSEGAVMPEFAARRAEIQRQLQAAAEAQGLRPIDDAALLDKVTGLVEQPKVLACTFDEAFLGVPGECLILTMKANQKYFPLVDGEGRLTNRFLVVSNIDPGFPGYTSQLSENQPTIAEVLRGKRKPEYTPHVDTGDFVVVVNAEKISVTGNKRADKRYYRHSGYPGGIRSRTLEEMLERREEFNPYLRRSKAARTNPLARPRDRVSQTRLGVGLEIRIPLEPKSPRETDNCRSAHVGQTGEVCHRAEGHDRGIVEDGFCESVFARRQLIVDCCDKVRERFGW